MKLAVLEERMKTMRAEYKTDIAVLGQQLAECDRDREKSFAQMREDMAKRETRMLLSVAAIIGLGITILGFIL